ncbi:MAG: NTP/NDP exchange transporter [Holosporales bacterium]|jgi:AAA family ATP:ADP antiporter|nr:NTP/NDP exchange transporter [Holosporales bacterium]
MSSKCGKSEQEFTGWRNILWPIHNHEMKKFVPMGLMMMFILFNYTLMRDTKDVLVVNAPGSGAEVLSFLKLFGVLPGAVLFMLVYTKIANLMSSEKIFYSIIAFFMVFFAMFGFVLSPLGPALHADLNTINSWRASCPPGLYWPLAAVANWTYSLYYIMAELWGSVAIGLLFWQFANATTKVTESRRFYAFYGMIGNVGLLSSAGVLWVSSLFGSRARINGTSAGYGDGYVENLRVVVCAILVAGLFIMFIYNWMQKHVLTDPALFDPSLVKEKHQKLNLSVVDSFKCIFKSSYLGLLLLMVLGYNICMPLVELIWKSQLKIAFPDRNDYQSVMGLLSFSTGAFTMIVTVVGMNILRRCSWRTAALITPIMFLVASALFFLLLNYTRITGPNTPVDLGFMTTTVVMLTVVVGLIQNVASKGTKYSLFDPTKQMAYIPLEPELKSKGQAAVEVVGGRLGKSAGAGILSGLLWLFGGATSLLSLSPILGPIILLIAFLWILAVFGLNKMFLSLTSKSGVASK